MKKENKSKNEILEEKIFLKRKSSWLKLNKKDKENVFKFCENYKDFLGKNKTERICFENIVKILDKNKFKDIEKVKNAKKGDRIYKKIKNKSLIAFIVGKNPGSWKIVGSHIDSPRLDLKPNPLYEDSDLAMLKTHYYGGIKKYHWVNTPLALHGVIFTKQGKKITISIGEKEGDPVFIIPDLLAHLSFKQLQKKAENVVEGEELNILVGNIPIDDKKINEKFKFAVLKKLNEEYGLTEEDFNCGELELVPASKASDVGFDRSMICAYGQDDKVCAYTSLMALMEIKNPNNTAVALFSDKEEIGSVGNTGAASFILQNFGYEYKNLLKLKKEVSSIMESSMAISADVTAGMNPNYKDVNDVKNVSYLGKGVSVEKYGGSFGKLYTNDTHAEYMNYIRKILNENNISWQTGELGKIEVGGGGTIAMFMSRYGMDCVDAGPCVLGMHSPCEVTSKADVYSAYKLYKIFMQK